MRRTVIGGAMAGGIAATAGAALASTATYFARRAVTPDWHQDDDVQVLSVGAGTVTLGATEETVAPGRYGLWLDGARGHARLGAVVERSGQTVTRELVTVDAGRLVVGPARWNQYYWAGTPRGALRLPHEDIVLASEVGQLPTWLVPGAYRETGTWAVLVHGRGATREECLRAVPLLHAAGITCLVPSYRNDPDAPRSPGGRYHLGNTEWRDVEVALDQAVARGAERVVLFGWSMGGAICLQVLARSAHAPLVAAAVLDAPVVDWRAVLQYHARLNRLPWPVGALAIAMLGSRHARATLGVEEPVDLAALDWVGRATELKVPILLLHSDDDEFVPAGPSRMLALARPDLITHVPSRGARHTKEWNVDPVGWETDVARFLRTHLGISARATTVT